MGLKLKKVTEICKLKIDTMETLLAGKFPKEFDEMFSVSSPNEFGAKKNLDIKKVF